MPVVNLSVATEETHLDKEGKRRERAEWHRVVVVGKLALTCHEYLKKGRQIFVEGRLRTHGYAPDVNGRLQHRTEIMASRLQFLGTRPLAQIEMQGGEDPAATTDPDSII